MNRHAFCISIYNKVFKFRKWFKYGLMAQKFQKQHAPSGRANRTDQKCFEILY